MGTAGTAGFTIPSCDETFVPFFDGFCAIPRAVLFVACKPFTQQVMELAILLTEHSNPVVAANVGVPKPALRLLLCSCSDICIVCPKSYFFIDRLFFLI